MANILTLSRILLIIPFAAVFFIDAAWSMTAALTIFALAAATDFLDGHVARARGEISALGAALDPLADKLLVAAAIILLVRNGVLRDAGVIAALIIVLREILVGGLREALGKAGSSLPVTQLAKWKTTAQLLAVALLLAPAPGGVAGQGLAPLAQGVLWMATALTLWTGADYVVRSVGLLRASA
ncbi:MAG: CDP-diacylglycerol--glycerol-3-phosphate 3-phosphatidyltransferase [Parvularculaceae bacterium]|nr:CDP-diacylglycerol--glycerol-3-phosphate 3-phosphatidyltransferase [Parvularculaceae bacterium]